MKSALFAGMGGSAKKDSDDSDEEEKKKQEAPSNEMNLLDMDSPGPGSQPDNQTNTNLLDTPSSQPPSGNLLDMMDTQPPPVSQPNVSQQLENIL